MSCLLLLAVATVAPAQAAQRPEQALCTVCVRRGAAHGPERVVEWREFAGESYAFCSRDCVGAFDAMPEGYAKPTLPRPAPGLALQSIEDTPVELAVVGSKATLVDFWATWCTPCVRAMPELSQLYSEHADAGLRIVGVSIDEDRKALERFLRKQAPSYPIAHDDGETAAWMEWKVPAIPALFLLDSQGQIVAQWSGEVPLGDVRSPVVELLVSD
jgi:thiol-disulfide isomerase/thioredoxin